MAEKEENPIVVIDDTEPIEVNEQMCELCNTMQPPLYLPCLDHNNVYHSQCLQEICQRQQSIRCVICGQNYRNVYPFYNSFSSHLLGVAQYFAGRSPFWILASVMDLDPYANIATQLIAWHARKLLELLRQWSLRRYEPINEPNFSPYRRRLLYILIIAEPLMQVDNEVDNETDLLVEEPVIDSNLLSVDKELFY